MTSTIARYTTPTFPLQATVSDTDPQLQASYAAIAETAAQRADFLSQNLGGITEYATISAGTTSYTPAAFASWQTRGRLQFPLILASGASCSVFAPPSAKNGDIWEIFLPAGAAGKTLTLDASVAGGAAPLVGGTLYTLLFFSASGLWAVVGVQSTLPVGTIQRYSYKDALGALPNASTGVIRSVTLPSPGGSDPSTFVDGDTIFARITGMHKRINWVAGVDQPAIVYKLEVQSNGTTVASSPDVEFWNEELNPVLYNGYASQRFPIAAEVCWRMNSAVAVLTSTWTVKASWATAGAPMNPYRSYNITIAIEVQSGK